MKVLYVLDSLAPGGAERSTVVLAPHLRDRGVVSTILTLRSAAHDLTEEAEAAGIEVRMLESGRYLSRVRALRRIISTGEYDIVHTALFNADQIGRIAAWGTGVPVVSSFVSTPYDKSRLSDPNVVRWKLRLVQIADAITGRFMVKRFHAVSDGAKSSNSRALRIPPSRITVAERGRDAAALGIRTDARRRAARERLDVSDEAEVLLSLGRQDQQKGQILLIEASVALTSTHADLVVLIAGKEGSASTDIERALKADRVADERVRLLGHRTDVGDLLCAADVLVISSHFEGTAGAAIEAMALSTPIVSMNLAGLRGVLEDDRNALLVAPGDSGRLASGIARVLDDKEMSGRIAASGRQEFLDRYTLDAAAGRLHALYESVFPLKCQA